MRLRVVEGRAVAVARHHSEEGRLVDGGLRAEGVEQERDDLAAEDVGRIADQPGPGVGGSADHHRAPKVSAAAGAVNSAGPAAERCLASVLRQGQYSDREDPGDRRGRLHRPPRRPAAARSGARRGLKSCQSPSWLTDRGTGDAGVSAVSRASRPASPGTRAAPRRRTRACRRRRHRPR